MAMRQAGISRVKPERKPRPHAAVQGGAPVPWVWLVEAHTLATRLAT